MLSLIFSSAVVIVLSVEMKFGIDDCPKYKTYDECKSDRQDDCLWELGACDRRPPCRTQQCVNDLLNIYVDDAVFCNAYYDLIWKDGKCHAKAMANCAQYTDWNPCYNNMYNNGHDCEWSKEKNLCYARPPCLDDDCCHDLAMQSEDMCKVDYPNGAVLWECEWKDGGCKPKRCVGLWKQEDCNNSADNCKWTRGRCAPQAAAPTAPPTSPPTNAAPTNWAECRAVPGTASGFGCDVNTFACPCQQFGDRCAVVTGTTTMCFNCEEIKAWNKCSMHPSPNCNWDNGLGHCRHYVPATPPPTAPPTTEAPAENPCAKWTVNKCGRKKGCKVEGDKCVEGMKVNKRVCKKAFKKGGKTREACEAVVGCEYTEKVKGRKLKKKCAVKK